MADRLEVFDVTVPAGTPKAAPRSTALTFDPGHLVRYEVVIPDGPAGLAGFAFAYGGQQIIPNKPGVYVTGNDDKVADDVRYEFVGQQWALVAYNTDVFAHTFHLRLYVDEIGTVVGAATDLPDVLPVTINAGTVDLTSPPDAPLDLGAGGPVDLGGDVTPLDIPADVVTFDTGTDVAPLDLPPDAPPVTDTGDVTDLGDATE